MSKFIQSKDVAWNFLGDNLIAFNLSGEREFHNMNPTAAMIFKTLEQPHTAEELIEAVLEEFEVEEPIVAADVSSALSEMLHKRLIVEA